MLYSSRLEGAGDLVSRLRSYPNYNPTYNQLTKSPAPSSSLGLRGGGFVILGFTVGLRICRVSRYSLGSRVVATAGV